MKIGLLLPSIYMHEQFGKNRIFAPGKLGKTLVDGLVEKGHEVFFYTAPGVQSRAAVVPGDEAVLKPDISYYLFRNRSEEERKYTTAEIQKRDFEYALTLTAYKDALKGKLDIIHSYHDFGAHYFNEFAQFPTVYTLHDPMPLSDVTVEYHRLKLFSHHPYISISDAQRKNFPINFVATVYHGLNLNEYAYGEGRGGYLIHFGRILEDKGTHFAIDAAKQTGIPLRIASSSVRANISQGYYEKKIKPQVDGKRVSEVGFLEGKEKSDYIGNALAFILPLQWDEPFGLVMIEAMACGTPVIAYNRGSVSEIVRDGVTGFIIDPDDEDRPGKGSRVIKKRGVEGLVEAVKRIGEIDRAICRKHVEENFTVEKMVEGYEKAYKRILEGNKK
ncbi:glycosyltransferase family 4 protein [Candidatus Microgenomates bacterium]|nr:glycosyltransferase family 4 protein [Candidatus Microgenomates bacterium]